MTYTGGQDPQMQIEPIGLLTGEPIVIAGPCSAESERQVVESAVRLAATGRVSMLRAGLWKPRTKPGSFEGVGSEGLPWLAKAREASGLPIATEVAIPAHVEAAARAGIDLLWIGARTSANPFAVQELADTIGYICPQTPVLIKNPINPDLDLWIGAIERLYKAGVRHLGAIHRGFSVYGPHIYRNKPCWSIPIELRRRVPGLPVICDPSHIGGQREYVAPLSYQAIDMGFDGLIIECHPAPDKALSDAAQQVTPDELASIVTSIRPRQSESSDHRIATLRSKIDGIDRDLLELLARRMELTDEIGSLKAEENVSVVQRERYSAMMNLRRQAARSLGLSEQLAERLFAEIHEESVKRQLDIVNHSDRH